jgi:hypothetical protein
MRRLVPSRDFAFEGPQATGRALATSRQLRDALACGKNGQWPLKLIMDFDKERVKESCHHAG